MYWTSSTQSLLKEIILSCNQNVSRIFKSSCEVRRAPQGNIIVVTPLTRATAYLIAILHYRNNPLIGIEL
jgi:hypothetical protein